MHTDNQTPEKQTETLASVDVQRLIRWFKSLSSWEAGRINHRPDGKPCRGLKARRHKRTGKVQIIGILTGMWVDVDPGDTLGFAIKTFTKKQ